LKSKAVENPVPKRLFPTRIQDLALMIFIRIIRLALVVYVTVFFLSACASTTEMMRDNPDPFRGYNRAMFTVNDKIDRAIIKPVAKAYQAVIPQLIDDGITNFFSNLGDVAVAANDLLQFKFRDAAIDVSRIVFNTTFGLLGFFDVASHMELPKHNEDFGQTLGYWTSLEGYYLVLPILGSSSTQDALGLVTDSYTFYPLVYGNFTVPERNIAAGVNIVDTRADLLRPERALGEAARDYAFVREAYLQRRRNLVYDGNPPKLEPDFEQPNDNHSKL
jgi:phospholipid-binding lipoprotein MlaA